MFLETWNVPLVTDRRRTDVQKNCVSSLVFSGTYLNSGPAELLQNYEEYCLLGGMSPPSSW
jgi:hypothetical protein